MMGKTPQQIGESQYIHSGTCRRLQVHAGACRHTFRQSTRSILVIHGVWNFVQGCNRERNPHGKPFWRLMSPIRTWVICNASYGATAVSELRERNRLFGNAFVDFLKP